jgi:hypothetical protein
VFEAFAEVVIPWIGRRYGRVVAVAAAVLLVALLIVGFSPWGLGSYRADDRFCPLAGVQARMQSWCVRSLTCRSVLGP